MSESPHVPATGAVRGGARRFRIGDLEADFDGDAVSRGGASIDLPKLSLDLLAAIVDAAPDFVAPNVLLDKVWPERVVGPETLTQRVKLLRAALGDDSRNPRYIDSVRGRGYRIVAPVTRLVDAPVDGRDAPAVPRPERASVAAASPPTSRSLRWIPALAGLLLVAAVAAIFLLRGGSENGVGPTPAERIRLAVLPIDDLSPDPENAFFANGFHAELIGALSRALPDAVVNSRTTMLTYRGRNASIREIAEELDATYVIEASLRRDAERILLTIQLVDSNTDASLWSETYDRDLNDALTLQLGVAAEVASRLSATLQEGPREDAPITTSPIAHDFYLKALLARNSAVYIGAPEPAVREVEALLTAAITADPDFGAAYAERATARMVLFLDNIDASPAQLAAAAFDLETAERLAPNDPNVLATRAAWQAYIDGNPSAAVATFARAQSDGLVDTLWLEVYSEALHMAGRHEDARRVLERALRIDPRNGLLIGAYAVTLAMFGTLEDAMRVLDFGIEQLPDVLDLQFTRAILHFGFTGDTEPWAQLLASAGFDTGPNPATGVDAGILLQRQFDWLMINGRIDELPYALDAFDVADVRATVAGGGRQPVARFRGWAALTLGDPDGAVPEGHEIEAFLSQTEETAHNRPFRRLLAAEAALFAGDCPRALSFVDEAARYPIADFPAVGSFLIAIQAHCGADARAVARLRHLVDGGVSVMTPAMVIAYRLFADPLANSPAYAALAADMRSRLRSPTPVR